jgi:FtsZ-interacting cell division protein ZipA
MSLLYWLPALTIYATCFYLWYTTKKPASDHPLGYSKPIQKSFIIPSKPQEKPDLLSLYIIPKGDGYFSGYELIQTLGSAQMHFGEHQMFHRINAAGQILFSLCRAQAPAHFEYNQMGDLKALGITIFIDTNSDTFNDDTLTEFFEATALIAEDLSGIICNENMQPVTQDDLEHLRSLCFNQAPIND